jgi:hypothetical protein
VFPGLLIAEGGEVSYSKPTPGMAVALCLIGVAGRIGELETDILQTRCWEFVIGKYADRQLIGYDGRGKMMQVCVVFDSLARRGALLQLWASRAWQQIDKADTAAMTSSPMHTCS